MLTDTFCTKCHKLVSGRVGAKYKLGFLFGGLCMTCTYPQSSKEAVMAHDGGPAFPHDVYSPYRNEDNKRWVGMSLRDWFAGQALAGIHANQHCDMDYGEYHIAKRAYAYADAMLKAREA